MKKLLKILGWVTGIVLALLLIIAIGLKLFFPVEKAKTLAIRRGSEMLGRPIAVRDVAVSFWGGLGIELKDVTIGSPPDMDVGNLLTADAIDLKLQILPLLSSKYRIDKLVIDNPQVLMVKNADGTNNYTFAVTEEMPVPMPTDQLTPEANAAIAAVSFERLQINGGSLDYIDDSTHTQIHLKGLNLSTALKNPRQDFYESSGKIAIDSVLVITDKPLPPLSAQLRYRADYDVTERQLTLKEAELTTNKLDFTLTGELGHSTGSWTVRASIKTKELSVQDLFSLLPETQRALLEDFSVNGDFSLDLNLEYDGSKKNPLSYAGMAVLSNLSMSKKGLIGKLQFRRALVDFKPDNLRMNIEDGTFDNQPFKGHFVVDNFSDPVINGALAGRCDLVYLQPFLPGGEKHDLAGQADFDIKVSGRPNDMKNLVFSGSVKVNHGRYNSDFLPEPIESFDLDIYFDSRVTHINKLSARTPSGQIDLSGRIGNLVPYMMAEAEELGKIPMQLDAHLDTRLDMAPFTPFLPLAGHPELKGTLALNLDVTGDAADISSLELRGKLSVENASFTDSLLPESVRAFETKMSISPDTIDVESMNAKFESSDISLSGKLIDPFPYLLPVKSINRNKLKKPKLLFQLTSSRFDVDRLFPEAVPGSGTNRAALPADSVPPLFLPDINGQGAFKIDTVVYSRVEFTQLTGKVQIHDRRINCYDVVGNVYSGGITGNTTIDLNDLSKPRYTGEFKATQIEIDDFVTRFSKFGGHLFGKTNLSGNYRAVGWETNEFINSLTMDGKADMQEGKMVTSGMLYSVVSGLAKQAGQSFEREQPLKNLSTNVVVRNGKVSVDQLKTKVGKAGDLYLDGFYTFNGKIEYRGSLLLSKEWTSQLMSQGNLLGGLAGLFTDKSVQRIKLPLSISGTVNEPTVNIDYSSLGKNIKSQLTKDANNLLEGLLKKKDKE